MPEPDDSEDEALRRLDRRLDAFEAARQPKAAASSGQFGEIGEGYRLLSGLLGGLFGGLGLGWTFDHFAHTSPFGLIGGLLLGLGVSIYAVVRAALVMSAKAQAAARRPPPQRTTRTRTEDQRMAAIEPMKQFMIHRIVPLPPVEVPGLGTLDLSITNSVLVMLISAGLLALFFLVAAKRQVVPGRMQALAEALYVLVDGSMTGAVIGDRGRAYLPFVFTLFLLIAVLNIIGLAPGGFSVTAQLAVTAALAIMTFVTVIVVGFVRNGPGVVKLFWPSGVHWAMAFFIGFFEFISFMIRPMTLAMRLFGNMIGGHVVMYMFASFIIALGLFGLHGGLASLGFVGSGISLAMVVALMALEFIVAFLQAFVFAALTCVYLNEVVNLDHGH